MTDANYPLQVFLTPERTIIISGPGDITGEACDAIVNAANSSLMGGGGVDGAIHRAGGPAILQACKAIVDRMGRLPPGQAVATTAGQLPARHVIHTVGPVWARGHSNEPATLASCHTESIRVADELKLNSIAFPAISTGVYGYPVNLAAGVAISSVAAALAEATHVREVKFVLFNGGRLRGFWDAAHVYAGRQY